MRKFKCYIIDDEPLAIQVVEQLLSKFAQFEICGKNTEPLSAFHEIKISSPDLLFLDIEMPDINGLDFLSTLQNPPSVIITTAYRDFAVKSFDLNVLDYLVKPIPLVRFSQAINKFLDRIGQSGSEDNLKDQSIFVRADRKNVKVNLNEILFFEGLKDYLKIVLTNKRSLIIKGSLGSILQKLPENQFIRVHKSFIVSIGKISSYTHVEIEVENNEIPIGRKFKDEVIEKLENLVKGI